MTFTSFCLMPNYVLDSPLYIWFQIHFFSIWCLIYLFLFDVKFIYFYSMSDLLFSNWFHLSFYLMLNFTSSSTSYYPNEYCQTIFENVSLPSWKSAPHFHVAVALSSGIKVKAHRFRQCNSCEWASQSRSDERKELFKWNKRAKPRRKIDVNAHRIFIARFTVATCRSNFMVEGTSFMSEFLCLVPFASTLAHQIYKTVLLLLNIKFGAIWLLPDFQGEKFSNQTALRRNSWKYIFYFQYISWNY